MEERQNQGKLRLLRLADSKRRHWQHGGTSHSIDCLRHDCFSLWCCWVFPIWIRRYLLWTFSQAPFFFGSTAHHHPKDQLAVVGVKILTRSRNRIVLSSRFASTKARLVPETFVLWEDQEGGKSHPTGWVNQATGHCGVLTTAATFNFWRGMVQTRGRCGLWTPRANSRPVSGNLPSETHEMRLDLATALNRQGAR